MTFKLPPKTSKFLKECLDCCNKPERPGHTLKCPIAGCGFTAFHPEQHSVAVQKLKQHQEGKVCGKIKENVNVIDSGNIAGNVINGNTMNSLTIINQLPDNGSLIFNKSNEIKIMEKAVNIIVEAKNEVIEAVKTTNKAQAKHIDENTEIMKELRKESRICREMIMSITKKLMREKCGTKKCRKCGYINDEQEQEEQDFKSNVGNFNDYYKKNCRPYHLRLPSNLPEFRSVYFKDIMELLAETSRGSRLSLNYIDNMMKCFYDYQEWCEEWDEMARQDYHPIIFREMNAHHTKKLTINRDNYKELRIDFPPSQLLDILNAIISFYEVVYCCRDDFNRLMPYSMDYYDELKDIRRDNNLYNNKQKLWKNWFQEQLSGMTLERIEKIVDYFWWCLPTEQERPIEYDDELDEESELFKDSEEK